MSEELLRPMQEADLECVLGWRNHPDVRRYMYTHHEITFAEHQRWFARSSCDPAKHLMLFEKDGVRTGFVNITQHSTEMIADWGFYLAPGAEPGTGRILGETALKYAFGELGLHKLCAQVLEFNVSSIRFHRKLAFQQEGFLRDQHYDGVRFHSIICFGLLHKEWNPPLEDIK